MNICAVRSLEVSLAEHHNNLWTNAEKLPHEPVMNTSAERWGVAQQETRLLPVDPRNTFDNLYICKHCGSIYWDEE